MFLSVTDIFLCSDFKLDTTSSVQTELQRTRRTILRQRGNECACTFRIECLINIAMFTWPNAHTCIQLHPWLSIVWILRASVTGTSSLLTTQTCNYKASLQRQFIVQALWITASYKYKSGILSLISNGEDVGPVPVVSAVAHQIGRGFVIVSTSY